MPTDSDELSKIRGNLGTALADRYEVEGAVADLNEAIANFQDGGGVVEEAVSCPASAACSAVWAR
jgi:hypothetical protein